MFRGTVSQASAFARDIVKECLARNSAALILVRNYPSGVEPSQADEAWTQTLRSALAPVDVRLLDRLIAARSAIFSFAERGLL